MPRATVCLPTYNERENLEPMVAALLARLSEEDTVLVIDDGSPDGTGELADLLANEHHGVAVLHRPVKQGLGPAYLAGFRRALADGADLVLEMDCDFSHDPDDVPRLIAAAADADVVLGSRYVDGGRIENWGAGRRFVSRAGSLYAQVLLAAPIHDLTGGFKAWRRELLEAIRLRDADASGYGFQVEMTWWAHRRGAKIVQVPIVFRERVAGRSKMSRAIVLEALLMVVKLRIGAITEAFSRD